MQNFLFKEKEKEKNVENYERSNHATQLEFHPKKREKKKRERFCDCLVCCLSTIYQPNFELCSCFYNYILYEAKSLNSNKNLAKKKKTTKNQPTKPRDQVPANVCSGEWEPACSRSSAVAPGGSVGRKLHGGPRFGVL